MNRSIFILCFLLASCGSSVGPLLKPKPKDNIKVDKGLNDISFNPAVDILFIVDDSGSMDKFQQQLAENSSQFIQKFFQAKFIDFHIGVTTSSRNSSGSVASGGLLHIVDGNNYVERKTTESDLVLARMLNVGTNGSFTEEFFSIFMQTFSPSLINGLNRGFYRKDAQLAIFVLTDTEDQSQFGQLNAYNFLLNLKNRDENKVHFAATVAERSNNCSGESSPPEKLKALARLHKNRGYVFDLCKDDYGLDLAIVAENLVKSVSTIYLEELPDVTTLKVTYGDIVIPNDPDKGWVYDADENAIYLSPNIDIRDPEPKKLRIKFTAIYK